MVSILFVMLNVTFSYYCAECRYLSLDNLEGLIYSLVKPLQTLLKFFNLYHSQLISDPRQVGFLLLYYVERTSLLHNKNVQ